MDLPLYEDFNYDPLDLHSNQIRLLTISYEPDAFRDQPNCVTLRTFDLADAPQYLALSYTWGELLPLRTIFLNDFKFSIRQNLHEYLDVARRNLQLCNNSIWFWIDQICIDQSNDLERGHQVARMAEIFERAQKVVLWLGPSFTGSDALMDAISACSSTSNLKPENASPWVNLSRLDYWNRLWVIQEIMLARKITVVLGSQSVSWSQFSTYSRIVESAASGGDTVQSRLHSLRAYRDTNRNAALSWMEALGVSKGSSCHDIHDKIFGLLGLVDPSLRLRPDYSKLMTDIYHEVLKVQRSYAYKIACRRDLGWDDVRDGDTKFNGLFTRQDIDSFGDFAMALKNELYLVDQVESIHSRSSIIVRSSQE